MGDFVDHFKDNRRDLINLIFLIFLTLSIPFAFKLAKEMQIFKPKASFDAVHVMQSGDNYVKFEEGKYEIKGSSIDLKITSPLELNERSDTGFVKTIYASEPEDVGSEYTVWSYPNSNGRSKCNKDIIEIAPIVGSGGRLPATQQDCSKIIDETGESSVCRRGATDSLCVGHKLAALVFSSPVQGSEYSFDNNDKIAISWNRIKTVTTSHIMTITDPEEDVSTFNLYGNKYQYTLRKSPEDTLQLFSSDPDSPVSDTTEINLLNGTYQLEVAGVSSAPYVNVNRPHKTVSRVEFTVKTSAGNNLRCDKKGKRDWGGFPQFCRQPNGQNGVQFCIGGRHDDAIQPHKCTYDISLTKGCYIVNSDGEPTDIAGCGIIPRRSEPILTPSIEKPSTPPDPQSALPQDKQPSAHNVSSQDDSSTDLNKCSQLTVPSAPQGYRWEANCTKDSCSANEDCPQNTIDSGVTAETSNWCYGFDDGNKCLMLKSTSGNTTSAISFVPQLTTPGGGATQSFRITEERSEIDDNHPNDLWMPYYENGVDMTYYFKDKTPGDKFLFVQFQDSEGNVINKEPYVLQVKILPDANF